MNSEFLQPFLLFNVFLIGVIVTVATQHAFAHFRPHPHEAEVHPAPVKLPAAVREHLLQDAQDDFQSVLDHSATELQRDLTATASRLNKNLEKLGTEIISDEMKRYRTNIDTLRKQTELAVNTTQAEINKHQSDLKSQFTARQTELEAKLAEEIAAERQFLTQQINTKLSDAVISFLTETMGHDVDLGAQSKYLISMLEEHKAELTKGITDEA